MADNGPVLPVLKVVGGLLGLLGWLFFLGLQRVWRATFGWLFTTLAGLLEEVRIPIPHFHDPRPLTGVAAWLRSLNRNVSTALARAADASEHLAVWLFSRVRLAFSWMKREIESLPGDVLHLGEWIARVYVPRLVRHLWHAFTKGWSRIWKYIRSQIPAMLRLLKRYGRDIARQAGRELHHWTKNLHLFAWLERKVIGFIRAAAKRLIALERHFVPKGLRKWLAAIFPIFGIAWLLGNSWRRLGEAVLRWSYRMVRGFIAWFGHLDDTISMKDVVYESQKLVPLALDTMDFWISEFHAQKLAPGPVDEPPNA